MDKNMLKERLKKLVLPAIVVVALALAGYFYYQVRLLKQNPQAVAQQEATDLINKVGKLMVLPEGETPTIATVSDPTALKDQPFFTNAKVGDKVLIYTKAKKAILYSETLNKILEVAPLNIGSSTSSTPTSTSTPTSNTTTNKTTTP